MGAKGIAMRYSAIVAVLLLTTNLATAQPLTASLRSGQDKLPAPQLEDRKAPGAFPLLDCLNSLVQGDTARTEKSCSAALLQNPQEHAAYKLRGYAYLIDHRFERASADFQAALRLKPQDHEDLAGYAQSLSGQGKFQEAVVQYRKALEVAPARAPYWNGLCWARAGTGRHLDQALKECNRALSLQPGAAGALNSRGLVHLRLKQFDRLWPTIAPLWQPGRCKPRPGSAAGWRGSILVRRRRERWISSKRAAAILRLILYLPFWASCAFRASSSSRIVREAFPRDRTNPLRPTSWRSQANNKARPVRRLKSRNSPAGMQTAPGWGLGPLR
jgi:Tfp pilus assembly protein PilF